MGPNMPVDNRHSSNLQGILLVYDITNRWSFDGIDRWIKEIDEVGVGYASPGETIGTSCDWGMPPWECCPM